MVYSKQTARELILLRLLRLLMHKFALPAIVVKSVPRLKCAK